MKRLSLFVLLILVVPSTFAQRLGVYQHGIVVRMHMGDCISAHHGFMNVMSGASMPAIAEECPEYTLVTDKVVYVVVGKSSSQLIPLAENIDFRIKDNQLAIRVDDERKEARYGIKDMVLRTDWERLERMHEALMSSHSDLNKQAGMEQVDQREH